MYDWFRHCFIITKLETSKCWIWALKTISLYDLWPWWVVSLQKLLYLHNVIFITLYLYCNSSGWRWNCHIETSIGCQDSICLRVEEKVRHHTTTRDEERLPARSKNYKRFSTVSILSMDEFLVHFFQNIQKNAVLVKICFRTVFCLLISGWIIRFHVRWTLNRM